MDKLPLEPKNLGNILREQKRALKTLLLKKLIDYKPDDFKFKFGSFFDKTQKEVECKNQRLLC